MPRRTPSARDAQASSAKRSGGTTWQDNRVQKGAARNRSAPPARWQRISNTRRTLWGSEKLVPIGLAVPQRMA